MYCRCCGCGCNEAAGLYGLFYVLTLIVFAPVVLVLRGIRYLRWRSAYKAQVRRLTAIRTIERLEREDRKNRALETSRRLDHMEALLEQVLKSQGRNRHA